MTALAAVPAAPSPMLPRAFRTRRLWRETYDTWSLELTPVDGSRRFDFEPGQFNMLYVRGRGEVPVSISGDPGAPDRLVHTTRMVGLVTGAVCQLRPGDVLGVRGPFGTAWPVAQASGLDVVVVAGGIGLAPLRPALHALCRERERYGRITVLYGARTPRDLLFRRDLRRWSARLDLDLMVTVDRGTQAWHGNVGVVTQLVRRAGFDAQHALAMICGPEVMIRFTVDALQRRGLADDRIWVSMERNMKCAVGLCGHCQFGRHLVCRDGAVFRYDRVAADISTREL